MNLLTTEVFSDTCMRKCATTPLFSLSTTKLDQKQVHNNNNIHPGYEFFIMNWDTAELDKTLQRDKAIS